MRTVAWLLGTVVYALTAGRPVQVSTWPGKYVSTEANNNVIGTPSFYHLPVYQHADRPLVPHQMLQPLPLSGPAVFQSTVVPEFFRPQPDLPSAFYQPLGRSLPHELYALLFPSSLPPLAVPERRDRAVEVWCGTDRVTVRVDRLQVNAWSATVFRVGSCQADLVSSRFLFFYFRPAECGGRSQVVGGQLVYTHILSSTPPLSPESPLIRAVALHLPIHCYYNRFHYSYQVGYRPMVQQATFLRSMKSKLRFSLVVSNAQWEPLPPGHWFHLGEPVFFVAEAKTLLPGERLYVDSCFITSSKDPNLGLKVDIITNYGCMTDSRREGSRSWIWSGGGSVVKFSVDTFLFSPVSQVLFLHCFMSVDVATSQKSKFCNYNLSSGRWEELHTSTSVCACCDFKCADSEKTLTNMVSSHGWRTGLKAIQQNDRSSQEEGGIDWQVEERAEGRPDLHSNLPGISVQQAKETDLKDSRGPSSVPASGTEPQAQLPTSTHQVEVEVRKETSPGTNSLQFGGTLHPRPKSILGVEESSGSGNVSSDLFTYSSTNSSSGFGSDGSTAVRITKTCSDDEEADCHHKPRTEKHNETSSDLVPQADSQFGYFDSFDAESAAPPHSSASGTSVNNTIKSHISDQQMESETILDPDMDEYMLLKSDEGGSGASEWPREMNMLPGQQTRRSESGQPDHHGEFKDLSCAIGSNCDSRTKKAGPLSRGQHSRAVKMNEQDPVAPKILQEHLHGKMGPVQRFVKGRDHN
ncbi:uncharacterized protein ACB058_012914 [Synchiropus picturatus]